MNRDTDNVFRDISGQVIYIDLDREEGHTIFYRKNGSFGRFGPAILEPEIKQIRAILFEEPKTVRDIMEFFPAKDHKIDQPKKIFTISRNFLNTVYAKRLHTLDKCGIRYLRKGWIRINHWEKRKKGSLTRGQLAKAIRAGRDKQDIEFMIINTPMHLPDLDAAIRQGDHILDKYRGNEEQTGEFAQLSTYDEIIREANYRLTRLQNAAVEEKESLVEGLIRVILQLEKCRNLEKKDVRKQLEKVAEFEDCRGRVNPGAFAARTVAALNDLARRIDEIRIIEPRIALRHEVLIFEKTAFEMQERQIGLMIRNLLHEIWSDPRTIDKLDPTRFGRIHHFTGLLWPSPFYERAELTDEYLTQAKFAVRKKDSSEAIRNLLFAHHLVNNEGFPPKNA